MKKVILFLLGLAVFNFQAAAEIYRCVDSAGKVNFTDSACPRDSVGNDQVDLLLNSSIPFAKPKNFEDNNQREKKNTSASGRRVKIGESKSKQKLAKRSRVNCKSIETTLEHIQNRLRQGYKTAEGNRLRKKRRYYEAQKSEHCR